MEKRMLLAIALCMGILFLWWRLFPPSSSTPPPPPPSGAAAPVAGAAAAPSPPPAQAPVAGQAKAPAALAPEELVELASSKVKFVLSSHGAALKRAQLLEAKYRANPGDPSSGLPVFRALEPEMAQLLTSFPESGFTLPAQVAWRVDRPAADTVVFTAETDVVKVEKKYRLDGSAYRLQLDVVVHNKTDRPQEHHLSLHVFARQDPEKKGGGFFSAANANLAEVACLVGDKVQRKGVEDLLKEQKRFVGGVHWVAAGEKFFTVAAVPYPEDPPRERTCTARASGAETAEGVLGFAGRVVPPRSGSHYAFAAFVGPKIISELDQVNPGGADARLGEVVDVTLAVLSRPLQFLLKVFHRVAHNWGLAIILLTVFIKAVTFYPTQRMLMSGKRMQKLGPKIEAIRKKYPNDKQRQSTETMNLYRAHGVNPFGGCLPSLIQMPIWIALYSTLNYAVELHRSPFVWFIKDLTAKDPFFVTPLLMGSVMFLQMRMSPTSADAQQQKMMTVMMPVMFTLFSLMLPSGLALYMLTSYLIGILQQLYVNRLDRKTSAPVPAKA